jgi:DNA-directed RNA polymerase subunit K/omega
MIARGRRVEIRAEPFLRNLSMKFGELISRSVDVVGSHFLLCNILSQRIKQLQDGAPPKVPVYQGMSKAEIALNEIKLGLIKYHSPVEE